MRRIEGILLAIAVSACGGGGGTTQPSVAASSSGVIAPFQIFMRQPVFEKPDVDRRLEVSADGTVAEAGKVLMKVTPDSLEELEAPVTLHIEKDGTLVVREKDKPERAIGTFNEKDEFTNTVGVRRWLDERGLLVIDGETVNKDAFRVQGIAPSNRRAVILILFSLRQN